MSKIPMIIPSVLLLHTAFCLFMRGIPKERDTERSPILFIDLRFEGADRPVCAKVPS